MITTRSRAALFAALILSGCASTRTVNTRKYAEESQRDSTATHTTTSAAATTATSTTASASGATFATKGTTASADTSAEVEVTTVATTYDTLGRPVVVRTEKRTNKSRRATIDLTTNGDISRWAKDTTTSATASTGTTTSASQTHTEASRKGTEKTKAVVTKLGMPWWRWALLGIGGLLALGALALSAVPGGWVWFFAILRRKKKDAPADAATVA